MTDKLTAERLRALDDRLRELVMREVSEGGYCREQPVPLNRDGPEAADTILAMAEGRERDETRLRMIVSHATGGNLQYDPAMSVNDICVEISRSRNEVFAHGKEVGDRDARAAMAENGRLKRELEVKDCLADGQYKTGVKAGWNMAIEDDYAALMRVTGDTSHIAELKRLRALGKDQA